MSLSADEQRELAETYREELEADHERRVAKVREREDREAARRARAEQDAREVARSDLKEQVREQFYKEHGYKLYVDSTGREHWLAPEEYAQRMARRKGRRVVAPSKLSQRRVWMFYAGTALLAVALGVLLAQ